MTNFYVGQQVVCIYNHSEGVIKKGEIKTIKAIKKGCCHSIRYVLDVGIIAPLGKTRCPSCKDTEVTKIWWLSSHLFAPLETIPASHEEAVKELIETANNQKLIKQ